MLTAVLPLDGRLLTVELEEMDRELPVNDLQLYLETHRKVDPATLTCGCTVAVYQINPAIEGGATVAITKSLLTESTLHATIPILRTYAQYQYSKTLQASQTVSGAELLYSQALNRHMAVVLGNYNDKGLLISDPTMLSRAAGVFQSYISQQMIAVANARSAYQVVMQSYALTENFLGILEYVKSQLATTPLLIAAPLTSLNDSEQATSPERILANESPIFYDKTLGSLPSVVVPSPE